MIILFIKDVTLLCTGDITRKQDALDLSIPVSLEMFVYNKLDTLAMMTSFSSLGNILLASFLLY